MHVRQPQQSNRDPTGGLTANHHLFIVAKPKLADEGDCSQKQPAKMCPGGVVVLAKALEQGPLRSRAAYCVLSGLLDESVMPQEQVAEREALLARMQGVRRFSALLCPMYVQEEEKEEADAGDKCMVWACSATNKWPCPSTEWIKITAAADGASGHGKITTQFMNIRSTTDTGNSLAIRGIAGCHIALAHLLTGSTHVMITVRDKHHDTAYYQSVWVSLIM